MHLFLALPGLLDRADARLLAPRLPALARLLAAAEAPRAEPDGIGAVLAPQYGVARQDDWPFAPLRLAALGGDPGDAYWLAADPVSLVAGRDDVRPAGLVSDLDAAEADALIATLNAHFVADDIVFVAPRADAWFVRTPSPPHMTTRSLEAAARNALRNLLPEGPDAGAWRRWLSEIQMLLHEHPVNVERERRGRAPVSSTWFSEGGTLPPRSDLGRGVRTWANEGIAAALATHAGMPAEALPTGLDAVLRTGARGDRCIVALDAPLDAAAVEAAWIAPAWKALLAGTFGTVTLIADGAGEALVWTVERPGPLQRLRARFAKHDVDALLRAYRAVS